MPSLSKQVEELEERFYELNGLCATILATLEMSLFAKHLVGSGELEQRIFLRLVKTWKERYIAQQENSTGEREAETAKATGTVA